MLGTIENQAKHSFVFFQWGVFAQWKLVMQSSLDDHVRQKSSIKNLTSLRSILKSDIDLLIGKSQTTMDVSGEIIKIDGAALLRLNVLVGKEVWNYFDFPSNDVKDVYFAMKEVWAMPGALVAGKYRFGSSNSFYDKWIYSIDEGDRGSSFDESIFAKMMSEVKRWALKDPAKW